MGNYARYCRSGINETKHMHIIMKCVQQQKRRIYYHVISPALEAQYRYISALIHSIVILLN